MIPLLKTPKSSLYPPKNFVPVRAVRQVRFSEHLPPWMEERDEQVRTPNQKKGLAYEALVHEMLESVYGEMYQPSPWIVYWEKDPSCTPARTCQPDGLIIDIRKGVITIVEVKLYNSAMAWWQLLWKYSPVVRALFPGFELRYVEIVKFDDPSIAVPGEVLRVQSLEELQSNSYGVMTWKPE